MTAATYTINHDRLDGSEDQGRVVTLIWDTGPAHRVLLIDDDRITYYDGTLRVADADLDEAVQDVHEWGAMYAGTTSIRVDGEVWI
jgi:hypothetical protein